MSSATKKFITFIAIIFIAILAIICSVYVISRSHQNNVESSSLTSDLSVAQINREVIEKMGYKGISELKSGDISGHFDIPENSVTQASIYIADSNASAMEIACFKLNTQEDEQKIMSAITDHISAKLKGFQESPKESEYIKNYETVSSQGYIFMVIGENADVARKTFLDIVEEHTE